jgi:hypothetical protein
MKGAAAETHDADPQDPPSQPMTQDSVLEYSKSLLYESLMHAVTRRALRDGNGEHIMNDWSFNLIEFWTEGNSKYLPMTFNMLVG